MQPLNGPFQGHSTQILGPCLKVCHLNIEGISSAKIEILSKLMREEKVDVIALQETHTLDEADLHKRGQIAGYNLIGAIHHKQYEVATYLNSRISHARAIAQEIVEEVFILTVNVSGVNIVNVYKPHNTLWNNPPLRVLDHLTMYIGDFNSHSLHWGYDDDDDNGVILFDWLSTNNMELVYSAKDKGIFHSAR
jgi:exonuclease III